MKPEIFIHVGPAKTGSRFLRENVFYKLPDINVIENEIFETKILIDKINIISNDGLSGHPFLTFKELNEHRNVIAERLHGAYPSAKIIVGKRERSSWLRSLYGHYIRYGGIYKYDQWYDEVLDIELSYIEPYIEYLCNLFDNVHIADFNDLKNNNRKFVKEVCDFISSSVLIVDQKRVNKGWNDRQLKAGRISNKFFKTHYNPGGLLPYHWTWNPRIIFNLMNRIKDV